MMNDESEQPDPAAVFGGALSLWSKCMELADANDQLDLSDCYNGLDQLMREVMRIGEQFETWACKHIAFDALDEVWPYLLQVRFGEACIAALSVECLAQFDGQDCLRVAMLLKLPIKHDEVLPLPFSVSAKNTVAGSPFIELRIQSMRTHLEDEDECVFVDGDEPFDAEYGKVFYWLSGVQADGTPEVIAECRTYRVALELASKLAPGIGLPRELVFKARL